MKFILLLIKFTVYITIYYNLLLDFIYINLILFIKSKNKKIKNKIKHKYIMNSLFLSNQLLQTKTKRNINTISTDVSLRNLIFFKKSKVSRST